MEVARRGCHSDLSSKGLFWTKVSMAVYISNALSSYECIKGDYFSARNDTQTFRLFRDRGVAQYPFEPGFLQFIFVSAYRSYTPGMFELALFARNTLLGGGGVKERSLMKGGKKNDVTHPLLPTIAPI